MRRSFATFAPFLVLLTASSCKGRVLDVVPHPQETSMWCWAASGQMVMHFLGNNVAQCTQANNRFGRTDCPCTQCSNPQPNPSCVIGGWPEFDKYGFTFQRTSNVALTWGQLKSELNHGRPVAFSWHWDGGGGHMMVVVGYRKASGQSLVLIRDPWSPCNGDYRTITYSAYVSGGGYTHWDDFHSIQH